MIPTAARSVPHYEHTDNVAMADSQPSFFMLTVGILWQAHTQSCTHSQLWTRPSRKHCGLSRCSQTESSPQACPMKPRFLHLGTTHTRWNASQAQKCGNMARTRCADLTEIFLTALLVWDFLQAFSRYSGRTVPHCGCYFWCILGVGECHIPSYTILISPSRMFF